MAKAFTALKQLKQMSKYDEGRSKKYAIFSAWKFYVKERILLKRYLVECGEASLDMSDMSTPKMRETAQMHEKELKRSFSSQGRSS
jgi:hypothetical protein